MALEIRLCSILNESNFNPDAIERQLSHVERNGVRAAYTHHARYMEERIAMMQWWAEYLDALRVQDKTGDLKKQFGKVWGKSGCPSNKNHSITCNNYI